MTEDKKTTGKKTIVSFTGPRTGSGASSESSTDGDMYFKDPGSLIQHISDIAALDSSRAQHSPDKPATRVSSLDSFRTSAPRSSLVMKKTDGPEAQSAASAGGNVTAFPKSSDKPRKK